MYINSQERKLIIISQTCCDSIPNKGQTKKKKKLQQLSKVQLSVIKRESPLEKRSILMIDYNKEKR